MKKTLIAGLVAFALITSVGTAMAGESMIGIKTYSEYGGIDATFTIMPQYMADHGFIYISDFDTPDCSRDVGTETITVVPNAPGDATELAEPTQFFQEIFVGEVKSCCPCKGGNYGPYEVEGDGNPGYGGHFDYSDLLVIEDIASDGSEQDDAYHNLVLEVKDCKGCDPCDSDCGCLAYDVSKDVRITTGWEALVSENPAQGDYLIMTQDIYVDTLTDCCADAFGELCSFNTYGNDYIYDLEMWGTGIDYEFDWIIGSPPTA